MAFKVDGNKLIYRNDSEILQLEPWGENSLRIRGTKTAAISQEPWALLDEPVPCKAEIKVEGKTASITNGKLTASFNEFGWLTYYNQKGEVLLEERWRVNNGGAKTSPLAICGREYKPLIGSSDYKITLRFEGQDGEKIYGLGQRQEKQLNRRAAVWNWHREIPSQVFRLLFLIKVMVSFGTTQQPERVTFANNLTEWTAECTEHMDLWITAGDTPAEIEEAYANATGKVPMMPDYATGFWQCKLRYTTQEQLLNVAREYKKRGIPISVIVCDFFHWTNQGEWKFDPKYWPDPQAMVDELKSMGIELMVSIWPTVDVNSENYEE